MFRGFGSTRQYRRLTTPTASWPATNSLWFVFQLSRCRIQPTISAPEAKTLKPSSLAALTDRWHAFEFQPKRLLSAPHGSMINGGGLAECFNVLLFFRVREKAAGVGPTKCSRSSQSLLRPSQHQKCVGLTGETEGSSSGAGADAGWTDGSYPSWRANGLHLSSLNSPCHDRADLQLLATPERIMSYYGSSSHFGRTVPP